MKVYTPEERRQYPSHIGIIERKTKTNLFIDAELVKGLVQDLNSNDFVRSELHQTTIHKFEIVDIYIKKVDDKHRSLIQAFLKERKIEMEGKTSLSLNDSLQGLNQSKQQTIN